MSLRLCESLSARGRGGWVEGLSLPPRLLRIRSVPTPGSEIPRASPSGGWEGLSERLARSGFLQFPPPSPHRGLCLSLVAACPSPCSQALPSSGSLWVGGEERQALLPRATTAGPELRGAMHSGTCSLSLRIGCPGFATENFLSRHAPRNGAWRCGEPGDARRPLYVLWDSAGVEVRF